MACGTVCSAQIALSDLGSTQPLSGAEQAVQAGDFKHAEPMLRAYLSTDERSSDARYLLAYTLLREGKAAESLQEYTRAAALRMPTAVDLLHVGEAYAVLNDLDDAARWMMRASNMEPQNADIWYNLGRVRYTQNRFEEARQSFGSALALAPRSVKAENNLGLSLEGLDRMPEAEAAYRQAIAWQDGGPAADRSAEPLINLGILLMHADRTAEGQRLLAEAAALSPQDPRVHEQLGQADLKLGSYEQAAAELQRASQLDPGKSNLHFLLGQVYRRLGRKADAAAEFAAAAKLAEKGTAHP